MLSIPVNIVALEFQSNQTSKVIYNFKVVFIDGIEVIDDRLSLVDLHPVFLALQPLHLQYDLRVWFISYAVHVLYFRTLDENLQDAQSFWLLNYWLREAWFCY